MSDHKRVLHMLARRAELSFEDERRVQEHVRECPECRHAAAAFSAQSHLLRSLPIAVPPPSLRQSVLEDLRRAPSPRFVRTPDAAWFLARAAAVALAVGVALAGVHQLRTSSNQSGASTRVLATAVPHGIATPSLPGRVFVRPPEVSQVAPKRRTRNMTGGRGGSSSIGGRRIARSVAPVYPPPPTAVAQPAPRSLLTPGTFGTIPSNTASPRVLAAAPPRSAPLSAHASSPTPPKQKSLSPARQKPPAASTATTATQSTPIPTPTAGGGPRVQTGAGSSSTTPFPVPSIPPTPTAIPLRLPAFVPAPPLDTPTPITTPIP